MSKRDIVIRVFCVAWISAQVVVTLWAQSIPGKLFGYQMFSDAQFMTPELYRELRSGERVHVKNGGWQVDGTYYSWRAWVTEYKLHQLGKRTRAKRSMDLTLEFAQSALDYVAERIEKDRETQRLVLVIRVEDARGNAREVTLKSAPRFPKDEFPEDDHENAGE